MGGNFFGKIEIGAEGAVECSIPNCGFGWERGENVVVHLFGAARSSLSRREERQRDFNGIRWYFINPTQLVLH